MKRYIFLAIRLLIAPIKLVILIFVVLSVFILLILVKEQYLAERILDAIIDA